MECIDVSGLVGNEISVMKSRFPWWSKIFAKIVLSRIPVGYSSWRRLGFFRHGHMDQPAYVLNVFNEHVDRAGLDGKLQGKTILEIGPGDSIATALVAACYGARSILIDSGSFATTSIADYHNIAEVLEFEGLTPPDISKAKTLNDVLDACGAKYLTKGLESFSLIKDGAIDLIFSQAVMEHVRKYDFFSTMLECFRVLTAEAVASHRIDLKDHLGGSLNNLRFSERIWESEFFARSGFYTNRIRFPEMVALFEKAGFVVEISDVNYWEQLPIQRKNLAEIFLCISDEDLKVSGFNVLLCKELI